MATDLFCNFISNYKIGVEMTDTYMTKQAQEKRNKKTKAKVGKELKAHKKGVADKARKAIKKRTY